MNISNKKNDDNEKVCVLNKRKSVKYLFLQSLCEFMTFTFIFYFIAKHLHYNKISDTSTYLNMYLLNIIALFSSTYVSYLKIRAFFDPNFIPSCSACAGEKTNVIDDVMSDVYRVLDHKKGSLFLNIPNSIFGIGYYSMMLYLHYNKLIYFYFYFSLLSCLLSIYLWKTMVCEIRRICIICMSIHAINFINLVHTCNLL